MVATTGIANPWLSAKKKKNVLKPVVFCEIQPGYLVYF